MKNKTRFVDAFVEYNFRSLLLLTFFIFVHFLLFSFFFLSLFSFYFRLVFRNGVSLFSGFFFPVPSFVSSLFLFPRDRGRMNEWIFIFTRHVP